MDVTQKASVELLLLLLFIDGPCSYISDDESLQNSSFHMQAPLFLAGKGGERKNTSPPSAIFPPEGKPHFYKVDVGTE